MAAICPSPLPPPPLNFLTPQTFSFLGNWVRGRPLLSKENFFVTRNKQGRMVLFGFGWGGVAGWMGGWMKGKTWYLHTLSCDRHCFEITCEKKRESQIYHGELRTTKHAEKKEKRKGESEVALMQLSNPRGLADRRDLASGKNGCREIARRNQFAPADLSKKKGSAKHKRLLYLNWHFLWKLKYCDRVPGKKLHQYTLSKNSDNPKTVWF